MQQYRRLIPYVLRQWPAMSLILAMTLVAPLATALAPWPLKLLVDGVSGQQQIGSDSIRGVIDVLGFGSQRIGLLVLAASTSLALFLLSSALDTVLSFTWATAGQRMVYDLAQDLFAQLQRLSLLFHCRRHVGDMLSRLSSDSYCVYTLIEALLITPAQHILTLVTIGLFAWRLDPVLTMVSLTIAPLMAGSVVFFGPRIKQRAAIKRKTEAELVSFVHQTLASVPLVQAFSTQERNLDHFRQIADGAVAISQKAVVIKNAYSMFVGLTAATGMALVLFVGAQRVLAGALTVGGLLVFIAYLRSLQGAAKGLLQIHAAVRSADASIERVIEILDSNQTIVSPKNPVKLDASGPLSVSFEHVDFGYETDQQVLHDIDLRIEPGTTVAFVGATGAGKTTLLSLLPRLFDVCGGRVCVGGIDVRQLEVGSLREAIAVVPQDPMILPLSIEQNIAYARPDATREQIRLAAEAAEAAEFIQRLPGGYDAMVGERGQTLSAGQRQRLAIARAILKAAPILILDEPTSNLDAGTEQAVMSAIHRLMRGKTCLVIAHRLSTVQRADRVVVLEAGRIIEQGTHEELMRRGGRYRALQELSLRSQEQT